MRLQHSDWHSDDDLIASRRSEKFGTLLKKKKCPAIMAAEARLDCRKCLVQVLSNLFNLNLQLLKVFVTWQLRTALSLHFRPE